jgi:hypothetical protein
MPEETTPNATKTEGSYKSLLASLENVLKTVAGFGLIFYIIGFIIVRTYLAQFGIDDLGFLSPRYVSVGLYYLVFVFVLLLFSLLFITSILFALYEFRPQLLSLFTSKRHDGFFASIIPSIVEASVLRPDIPARIKKVMRSYDLCVGAFSVAFSFLFLRAGFWTIIQLAFGERYFWNFFVPLKSVFALSSTEIDVFLKLKGWLYHSLIALILPISIVALIFVMIRRIEKNEEHPKKLKSKISRFFADGFKNIFLFFLLLFPISFFQNIQEYSLSTYPLIDRAIGGGRGTQVQFVADPPEKDKTPILGEIIPLQLGSNSKTVPVCLIEQSDKNYYIVLGADGKELPKGCVLPNPDSIDAKSFRAIQIDKSLVKGVVYIRG